MKKVVEFDSVEQWQAYRRQKTIRELGEGSEGICYLGKDGKAYKDFSISGFMADEYLVNDVITIDDVFTKSFVLPDTVFAINNRVVGYTSFCVPRDYFDYKYMFMNGIDHIDFDKLIAAYGNLYNDALVLANAGIRIFDLSYNVMFDGENLYGIDTCGYTKTNSNVEAHNIACVSSALKDLFSTYAVATYNDELNKNMEVIPFLTMVERKYKTVIPRENEKKPYTKKY